MISSNESKIKVQRSERTISYRKDNAFNLHVIPQRSKHSRRMRRRPSRKAGVALRAKGRPASNEEKPDRNRDRDAIAGPLDPAFNQWGSIAL